MRPGGLLILGLIVICVFLWFKNWQVRNGLHKTQLELIELTVENQELKSIINQTSELFSSGCILDILDEIRESNFQCKNDSQQIAILLWNNEACSPCNDFAIEYWKSLLNKPSICSLFLLNNFTLKDKVIFDKRYDLQTTLVNHKSDIQSPILLIVDQKQNRFSDVLVVSKENIRKLKAVKEELIN